MTKPHHLKEGQRVTVAFTAMRPLKGRLLNLEAWGSVAVIKATDPEHDLIGFGEALRVSTDIVKPRRQEG